MSPRFARYRPYLLAAAALTAATLVRALFEPWLHGYLPFPTYLVAAVFVSAYGSLGAGLLTVFLGGLLADWLFIPERGSLFIPTGAYPVHLLAFYLASGVIVVLADRLRRRRMEVLRGQRELAAADRSKDEFISVLAHELRNPLAPIANATEIIRLSGGASDPRAGPALDIIDRQVRQLQRLIDDLMDVARVNTGHISVQHQRIDLADVIRQAVDTMLPRFDARGVVLRVAGLEHEHWIDGDRARVVQIVSNLLDNAAKATPRGGYVDIELHRSPGQHRIIIRDTGVGIAAENIERIFDPFVQIDGALDGDASGLGLGLHIVKRLMTKHGGRVRAYSAGLGYGSEFTLEFPSSDDVPAAVEPVLQPRRVEPASRRVLVIDDNVDAGRSIQLLLEALGHEVALAASGAEGLERAEEVRPETVLVDLRMPGMDGLEVGRRLRARFGNRVRLVAVTGFSQQTYRDQSRQAGFDEFLVKPPSMEALSAALAPAA